MFIFIWQVKISPLCCFFLQDTVLGKRGLMWRFPVRIDLNAIFSLKLTPALTATTHKVGAVIGLILQ